MQHTVKAHPSDQPPLQGTALLLIYAGMDLLGWSCLVITLHFKQGQTLQRITSQALKNNSEAVNIAIWPQLSERFPGDSELLKISAVTDEGFENCGYMNTCELSSTLKASTSPSCLCHCFLRLLLIVFIPLSSKQTSRTEHMVAVSGLVFLFLLSFHCWAYWAKVSPTERHSDHRSASVIEQILRLCRSGNFMTEGQSARRK